MDLKTEVFTTMLEEEQFYEQVDILINLLEEHQVQNVEICFGVGWDDDWVPFITPTKQLRECIKNHELKKGECLYGNDVYLEIENRRVTILFCHETDLHVTFTQLDSFVAQILHHWHHEDIIHYIRRDKEEITWNDLEFPGSSDTVH